MIGHNHSSRWVLGRSLRLTLREKLGPSLSFEAIGEHIVELLSDFEDAPKKNHGVFVDNSGVATASHRASVFSVSNLGPLHCVEV